MKKYKVYLDTSVISHLYQLDAPEKMAETKVLWEKFKNDEFDIYLSDVTLEEVNACREDKKEILSKYLNEIKFTKLELNDDAFDIADKIIEMGILKNKSRDDANHIGIAVVNDCDYIISWNFKHMVNVKTVNGVRAITNLSGYKSIDLVAPNYFLEED